MKQIASLHWWMIKDQSFFKSMQHDDSDMYTKQSESIRAYFKKIQTTFIFGNLSECDK